MTASHKAPEKMIPIWVWVGMVLSVYGLIVTLMGVYYVFEPEQQTALWRLNPCLWWGAIMIVAGALFIALPMLSGRSNDLR